MDSPNKSKNSKNILLEENVNVNKKNNLEEFVFNNMKFIWFKVFCGLKLYRLSNDVCKREIYNKV